MESSNNRPARETVDYRGKYRTLKRKLKCLIFENESFQEELRKTQRQLLKINRDKSFLLDRLLQYEKVEDTSSESDSTANGDSDCDTPDVDSHILKKPKRKAASIAAHSNEIASTSSAKQAPASTFVRVTSVTSAQDVPKKPARKSSNNKKTTSKSAAVKVSSPVILTPHKMASSSLTQQVMVRQDGHMTSEEIERHLESKKCTLDLLPESQLPTVPNELFSNDLSNLSGEIHPMLIDSSPSQSGEEIEMNIKNITGKK